MQNFYLEYLKAVIKTVVGSVINFYFNLKETGISFSIRQSIPRLCSSRSIENVAKFDLKAAIWTEVDSVFNLYPNITEIDIYLSIRQNTRSLYYSRSNKNVGKFDLVVK